MNPILAIANIVLILLMLIALPIWLISKLRFPLKVKLVVGFNYLALLLILYMQLAIMAGLLGARQMTNRNLANLSARLQTEEPADLLAALKDWLNHDEATFYMLPESSSAVAAPKTTP